MFVAITALLSICQLIFAEDLTESGTLAANIYDDAILKEILQRLDLLQTANENLRLRIDSQNLIIDQQFIKLQNEIKKGFEDQKLACAASIKPLTSTESKDEDIQSNCEDSGVNLIDIRGDFTNEQQKIGQSTCRIKEISNSITTTQSLPANCVEAFEKTGRSGVHRIKIPDSELGPFYVYCLSHIGSEMEKNTPAAVNTSNAAWMIVQRRRDGSIDFHRNWVDYQHGIGNLEGEFFIGLDKLHALTQSTLHELWIQLEDFEGIKHWAKYNSFAIGGKDESYILNVLGAYSGDAGDSFSMHAGFKWTTKDVDNDVHARGNCANLFNGAWWYGSCHESNLNGQYLRGAYSKDKLAKGIDWTKWHGHNYSLKYVHMAIRPVQ